MVRETKLAEGFQSTDFAGIYTGVVAVTLWAVGLCYSLLLMNISLTGVHVSSFKE